ncbi:VIT1/CCC1 transporter family protein [Amnibacterium sp.]|uniref:VIT1/CCC1 transporter family protein n=1 Tax=Amnibacterium sp. TaxID=1872496 RepID=UPI003F7C0C67
MAQTDEHDEPHGGITAGRLNWLRAGVLGANDGIVSVSAIMVGVAAATPAFTPILAGGLSALIGGAISMALGEYVSVSSQRDSQHALIAQERRELATTPEEELAELEGIYRAKGLSAETARTVAKELTENDALAAHLDAELGIDPDDIANPWTAAFSSAIAFLSGGILPLLALLLAPQPARIAVIVVVVLVALAITGVLGARLGGSPALRPAIRVLIGGALALIATILAGVLLGSTGA